MDVHVGLNLLSDWAKVFHLYYQKDHSSSSCAGPAENAGNQTEEPSIPSVRLCEDIHIEMGFGGVLCCSFCPAFLPTWNGFFGFGNSYIDVSVFSATTPLSCFCPFIVKMFACRHTDPTSYVFGVCSSWWPFGLLAACFCLPSLPPSLVNSVQTTIHPCQLWSGAGDCSVPASESERLCLDPPVEQLYTWKAPPLFQNDTVRNQSSSSVLILIWSFLVACLSAFSKK